MTKLTLSELLSKFDVEVHPALLKLANKEDVLGVVVFENLQMGSSEFGLRTALAVGPNNTYKMVAECEKIWLRDLPSQRQYATAYYER